MTAKRRADAYASIGIRTEEHIPAPASLLPLALYLSGGAVGTQKRWYASAEWACSDQTHPVQ